MRPASKPRWQQVTAVVSLSAGGAITGFSFVPRAAADLTSPTSMPIRLLALKQAARPAPADDATLRSAIVNVANYYLRMAEGQTPAEMEAIIWQHDSVDGVDHGQSCAAFASLTLELAAHVVGQQSWVTGGTSYPWPLHKWADVRVDPNPASLGVMSVLQDAQAHYRWHPLGDGYAPLPGDWVMFEGHVEVVTAYAGGVLSTVGGDSLPNLSVNAHEYRGPLDGQGVVGFVNNGEVPGTATTTTSHSQQRPSGSHPAKHQAATGQAATGQAATGQAATGQAATGQAATGQAAIPGTPKTASPQATPTRPPRHHHHHHQQRHPEQRRKRASHGSQPPDLAGPGHGAEASVPGAGVPGAGVPQPSLSGSAAAPVAATLGTAAIPGLSATARRPPAGSTDPAATPYRRHRPSPAPPPLNDGQAQQAFIGRVAPGAVATERKYGVPAAVTIAQAIDESGWGQSSLATKDHNLFGIKGAGPAGTDPQPTREYDNGKSVARTAPFRVYHNVAESIDDHGKLLATSEYYRRSMADRQDPNAFAAALTGIYATDPDYGTKLIGLMRRYNLYRYDSAKPAARARAAAPGAATIPGLPPPTPAPAATPTAAPAAAPTSTSAPAATPTAAPAAAPTAGPVPSPVPRVSTSPRPASSSGPARPASQSRGASTRMRPYQQHIPQSVRSAFLATARSPLVGEEPLYRDVASHSGIRWELLAACDWMQCEAQPRYSPVHGERLGTVNPDNTVYRTRSEALEQCADDLAELAWAVYRIDLTARAELSVRDLANAFAAFRWGGLLRLHHTSAMEFPYSVAGLTAQHMNMRWPNIDDLNAPDKPGRRFRMPFGAVPIVLGLNYPATV